MYIYTCVYNVLCVYMYLPAYLHVHVSTQKSNHIYPLTPYIPTFEKLIYLHYILLASK